MDPAVMQRWAESALKIRGHEEVLLASAIPDVDTAFGALEIAYDRESISQWCREGLRSASDHLMVWADHAVPLVQYKGQVVHSRGFRWYFTLLRGAIEGFAQSAWLSSSGNRAEALARLLRIARSDVGEQAKAWRAMGRDPAEVRARLSRLDADAADSPDPSAVKQLPAMVDLIRAAASSFELDPDLFEGHWRACSAAAHGKDWPILELQVFESTANEWRPGQFLTRGHLDPERWTSMLEDVLDLGSRALIRYLQRTSTSSIPVLLREGLWRAAQVTPQRDDGTYLSELGRRLGLE
ncbi:hypothetical protein GCM10009846_01550 [Agrococcus versicolor]|uniref:Uncharacterized protein n=1 Tax=Agrococcus versicolor TaxID=501482 RepID=A0ABN3AKA2_9MICO